MENLQLPNLEKLNKVSWTKLSFKNPVVFLDEKNHFIIREMRNVRGNVMVELTMDDDKMFRNIKDLNPDVKKLIDHHLMLQPV